MKFSAIYCLYEDYEYLELSILSIYKNVDRILFLINDIPWMNEPNNSGLTEKTINEAKRLANIYKNIEIIYGHWQNEAEQRNYALNKLYIQNFDYSFIVDSDEIYFEKQFLNIKKFVLNNSKFDAFHIEWNTYWKKQYYKIYPRENFKPVIAVKIKNFNFIDKRLGTTSIIRTQFAILNNNDQYNGIVIPEQIAICYHLSYARSNDSIKRKLQTSSHNPEFIKNWYDDIWLKWDKNNNLQNLHPISPLQYKIAIKEDLHNLPPHLEKFIKNEKLSNRLCSIIILNWNSCDLLKRCIELVEKNTKRKYELIIVDNGSNDESIEYIKTLKYKYVLNNKNFGFAGGVNCGIKVKSSDSDICLLNVDAEVQENWLDELYNSLINNYTAGIVGPLGNEVESGYQSKNYIDKDIQVPNLMGFCMLIMNEVYEKIGLFDESFKIGGYEDNDYGMRSIMAGYNLFISSKSLVIHKAHQVFNKNGLNYMDIDPINKEVFYNKFYSMLINYSKYYNFFENKQIAKITGLIKE